MAEGRARFMRNVRAVADEERQASARLIRRLKGLTPAQLLREPMSTVSQLSMRQYRDIVSTIAPELSLPKETSEDEALPAISLGERIHAVWRGMTTLARRLVIGTLIVVIGIPVTVLVLPWGLWWLVPYTLVRPSDSTGWPSCRRLAWHIDGCLYHAPADLYWEWVAAQAAQPVAEIRANNRHLPAAYIPARSAVVIWHGRGQLAKKAR